MTQNAALKRLARTRAKNTGESYAAAQAVISTLSLPNVVMGINRDTGFATNGSLDGEVLSSYKPLMEKLATGWTLMNNGPSWNQLFLLPSEYDDMVANYEIPSIYVMVSEVPEPKVESDGEGLWDITPNAKLQDCKTLYVGEFEDESGSMHSRFPIGMPPVGERFGDGTYSQVLLRNTGKNFIEDAVALLNWVAQGKAAN